MAYEILSYQFKNKDSNDFIKAHCEPRPILGPIQNGSLT